MSWELYFLVLKFVLLLKERLKKKMSEAKIPQRKKKSRYGDRKHKLGRGLEKWNAERAQAKSHGNPKPGVQFHQVRIPQP